MTAATLDTCILAQETLNARQLYVAFHYEKGDDERRWSREDINRAAERDPRSQICSAMSEIYVLFQETVPGQTPRTFHRHTDCSLVLNKQQFKWAPKKTGSFLVDGLKTFIKVIEKIDLAIQDNLQAFVVPSSSGEQTVTMLELITIIDECTWVKNLSRLNLECRKSLLNFAFTYIFKPKLERFEKLHSFLEALENSNTNINLIVETAQDTTYKESAARCLQILGRIPVAFEEMNKDPLRALRSFPQDKASEAQKEYEQRNYVRFYTILANSLANICEESTRQCQKNLKRLLGRVYILLYSGLKTLAPQEYENTLRTIENDPVNWDNIGSLINEFARHIKVLNRH